MTLSSRTERFDPLLREGAQFSQPMLEFSGVCEGCSGTPYMKLLAQFSRRRLMVANAIGCSSILGWHCRLDPVTADKNTGNGIAWGINF